MILEFESAVCLNQTGMIFCSYAASLDASTSADSGVAGAFTGMTIFEDFPLRASATHFCISAI
jgi:hypothetical protein